MRESPSPLTPARSNERAISGEPRVAFVTAVTEMPRSASRSTSVRALWWILSRSISNRGAVIVRPRSASSQAPETPQGPSRPVGRVTGLAHRWRELPSSLSYSEMATSTSASVMFSWLIVRPMTFVSAKVWMRLISVAGVGIAICSKSQRLFRPGACCSTTPSGQLPRRMKDDVE